MRAVLLTLFVGSLAAAQPEVAPPPRELKPDPSRDLKLIAKPVSQRVVAGEYRSHLTLTLVNTSKTFTYPVVKPGDGSEVGWREPHVFFSAEYLVAGKWVAQEHGAGGRCGLFNRDWQKDVVELKPGAELDATYGGHHYYSEGRVRLRGHYEYRGGMIKALQIPAGDRGKMGDTAAFAVKSEPVEFDVVPPLELKATAKRALKVGTEYKLSEIIDVTLTNNTDAATTVRTGGGADPRLKLWVGRPRADDPAVAYDNRFGSTVGLKAGQTLSLVGDGGLANGAEGKWSVSRAGTYPLKVTFSLGKDFTETTRPVVAWTELIAE